MSRCLVSFLIRLIFGRDAFHEVPSLAIVVRRICWAGLLGFGLTSDVAVAEEFKVLVFSKTDGFHHDSIPAGIAAIQQLGSSHHFAVDHTENSALFTDANLAQYRAVVFLSTLNDVLDDPQQGAFQRYIRSGGGFVGIHSASSTEEAWPWYGDLVGAYYDGHPDGTFPATILVTDRVHPSTRGLPERWVHVDEWYDLKKNPKGQVHVLAWVDERTYSAGSFTIVPDHPIAWCQEFDGGRSWYTALGHEIAAYSDPLFRSHILGGILWAAGVEPGVPATVWTNFEKRQLDPNPLREPMALDIAPDGRLFYIERAGNIFVFKTNTLTRTLAARLNVDSEISNGLLGIALDPGFATNQWVYLFYGPAGLVQLNISRFAMNGDFLEPGSERILLTIPIDPGDGIANHLGGDLEFAPDGNLYIGVGDNTEYRNSQNYTPIDERTTAPARWNDAQRTAANTADLRGKILRITPQPDGTFTIPPGNLYLQGTARTRPEIYVMGCRNPFRITVDPRTGWLYWADLGPDAQVDSATRGPAGYDEWNQARGPGFYGWPYAVGDNKPYIDFDFVTGVSRGFFNLSQVVNDSPHNTGLTNLPPAQPAWIWYPSATSPQFPELGAGSGRAAMLGFVYHYQSNLVSARKLPAYYDNALFVMDFTREFLREVRIDSNGGVLKVNDFLSKTQFQLPIEMKGGPDGAIYLIEYGADPREQESNGRLYRISYTAGNHSPLARALATPTSGPVPLTVQFSSADSTDPDVGDTLGFAWDFDLDGVIDSTAPNPVFVYQIRGNYTARLTVTDSHGGTAVGDIAISAGNSQPVVTIEAPPAGSFIDWGAFVRFKVRAEDLEDGSTGSGTIPCAAIELHTALGHDEHSHNTDQFAGCQGAFQAGSIYTGSDNFHYLLSATLTDRGTLNVAPLTTRTTVRLNPTRWEAEFHQTASGVLQMPTSDPSGGGQDLIGLDDGDYVSYVPMNLTNITAVSYRVAGRLGGRIEVHLDQTDGPLISTAHVFATSGTYTNVAVPVTDPGGSHQLFFVFRGTSGSNDLLALNWIQVIGPGVNVAITPFLGQRIGIPGTIQAEDFDEGGLGVGFFDTTPGNTGGVYRINTDVDIVASGDTMGGFAVSEVQSNEWLHYSVQVTNAGYYTLELRVTSAGAGGTLRVELDRVPAANLIAIPDTGGLWVTIRVPGIGLSPGAQLLRLAMVSGGVNGSVVNLNWFRFILENTNAPPLVSLLRPQDGAQFSAPARIELSASATDIDGSISKVEFFSGSHNKLGEAVTSPYSLVWTNVLPGEYFLTARAIDNGNLSRTSSAVRVRVVPTTPFVRTKSGQTQRNNFDGWVGMRFTVTNGPVLVTELGRLFVRDNIERHTVKLLRADAANTWLGEVSIATRGGVANEFQYGVLPEPILLQSNTSYFLLSSEVAGKDVWYDLDTSVTTDPIGICDYPAYAETNGLARAGQFTPNKMYGPVDFRFGLTSSLPTETFNIITLVSPAGAGTTTGQGQYASGSMVTVVATPNASYTFDSWTANGSTVSLAATYAFVVRSNRNLQANFSLSSLTRTTNFVVSHVPDPDSVRFDFSGWVGMHLRTHTNLWVTALGRIFQAGNTGIHSLKLVDAANGSDVAGSQVDIAMFGGNAGQFKYAQLSSPLLLRSNLTYFLVSQELINSDGWWGINTVVSTTPVASVLGGVWSPGGNAWNPVGNANQSYVPVDFRYKYGGPLTPQLKARLENHKIVLTVSGPYGRSYAIQASQNLTTWTVEHTEVLTTGSFSYEDDTVPGKSFYRVEMLKSQP